MSETCKRTICTGFVSRFKVEGDFECRKITWISLICHTKLKMAWWGAEIISRHYHTHIPPIPFWGAFDHLIIIDIAQLDGSWLYPKQFTCTLPVPFICIDMLLKSLWWWCHRPLTVISLRHQNSQFRTHEGLQAWTQVFEWVASSKVSEPVG